MFFLFYFVLERPFHSIKALIKGRSRFSCDIFSITLTGIGCLIRHSQIMQLVLFMKDKSEPAHSQCRVGESFCYD